MKQTFGLVGFITIISLWIILAKCEYSNLDTIQNLTLMHDTGDGTIIESDPDYQKCMSGSGLLDGMSQYQIYGPFYRFAMEFSDVRFACSPCQYSPRVRVTWYKLTFENKIVQLSSTGAESDKYVIDSDDSILIKSVNRSDFGTYYCETKESIVGMIWSLEIEAFDEFDIIKAKHWMNNETAPVPQGFKVTHKWIRWTDCNKCGWAGKRHRIGYCYLQKSGDENPIPYAALKLYTNGLSCRLFLNLHPDAEPELINAISWNPIMLVGYCKIPCGIIHKDIKDNFTHFHPKIQQVYQEQLESLAEEKYEASVELNKERRKWGIGRPSPFEGFLVFLLLCFQIYMIIYVCRNRKVAK